ncbi:MAG: SymE family type I addiction module toxin [Pseudomonadales bacterium]
MATTHDKPVTPVTKEQSITITKTYYDYKPCSQVPRIQMKGYWLERAGFTINTPAKARNMEDCLVLTTEGV